MRLSADLLVNIGGGFEPHPFELVQDPADAVDELEAVYDAPELSAQDRAQPPGRYRRPVGLVRYGRASLRLYAPPGVAVGVRSLQPPAGGPEPLSWTAAGRKLSVAPSGYAGAAVADRGRRSERQIEVLTWANATEARIRYWYEDPAVSIIEASAFVGARGESIAAPTFRGAGRFRTTGPAWGALVVEYTASFRRYHVWYDIPGLSIPYEIAGRQVLWPLQQQGVSGLYLPPVHVIAQAGDRLSMMAVTRRLLDWRISSTNRRDDLGDDVYTEQSSERVERRVSNPEDPDQYVDVERYREAVFIDDSGRRLVLRMKV